MNSAGYLGSFPGSDGIASADGTGSSWTNSISLTVGEFGTASLSVSNGGIVAAPVITIGDTGEVLGDGGVLAGDVVNGGLVSPGGSAGTLTIDGDYEQTAFGILNIELDNLSDLLSVNGQAVLGGALNLTLADGFTPPPEITILTADSIVGTFDVQTCEAQFNLIYEPGAVKVTVAMPDPPANCDEAAWISANGGDFDNPANWLGGVTPRPLTTAVFDGLADQTFSVYDVFVVTDVVTDRLIVRSNRLVQFKLAGRDYEILGISDPSVPSIVVGDVAGRSAELSIQNVPPPNVFHGVFGSTTSIAEEPGSFGILTVTDPFTLFGSDDLYVGRRGVGLFEVLNAASANASGVVSIGTDANAVGEVLVDGAEWTMSGTGLFIGEAGEAALSITNGGQLVSHTLGPVVLAQEQGSTADVTVTGPGSAWVEQVATMLVAGEGDATVTVADGGIIRFPTFSIRPRGEIRGDGSLTGDVVNVGAVRPGAGSSQSMPGALSVDGDYRQVEVPPGGTVENSGSLLIDVAGYTPGAEYDQLLISGNTKLGGGLFVSLADTFQPQVGIPLAFLQTGAVDPDHAVFDVAFTTGLPEGKFVAVDYGAGGAAAGVGQINLVVLDLSVTLGFGDPASTTLAGLPAGAVAGNFNPAVDSFPDIAVAVPFNDSVIVLINDGTGSFPDTIGFPAGGTPTAITTGPLDNDGFFDLAVTRADNKVAVLTNDVNGTGVFTVDSTIDVGSNPSAIAAADLDGDTIFDLVVANAGDDNLHVLVNQTGNADFAFLDAIPVGSNPVAVDPSDIDNDKDVDAIFTANQDSDDVSMVTVLGGGNFSTAVSIGVGDAPVDLTVEHFDGNGFADFVTANNNDGTMSVVLNNGDGTFAPAVNLPVGELPRSLAALDMEGDQDLDLAVVVTDEGGNRVVRVLRNDLIHDGTQEDQLSFVHDQDLAGGLNPELVLSADVDQDGILDVVTINEAVGGAAAGLPEDSLGVLPNISGSCLWDCQGIPDGDAGAADFLALLAQWGQVGAPCDFDGNGVDVADFLELLAHWGPCPSP
ncbi:MAG: FG-GAP-like repeat-containing protein [Planctomycetota bacterium]